MPPVSCLALPRDWAHYLLFETAQAQCSMHASTVMLMRTFRLSRQRLNGRLDGIYILGAPTHTHDGKPRARRALFAIYAAEMRKFRRRCASAAIRSMIFDIEA